MGNKLRKVTCISLLTVALLMSGFNFSKPTFEQTIQGVSGTYVVPYSGLYNITAVGCQGAVYNSAPVGGTKLSGQVYLNAGDVIKIKQHVHPSSYVEGDVLYIPNGETSEIYVNDEIFCRVLGGHGSCAQTVTSNINTVDIMGDTSRGKFTVHFNVHHHDGSSYGGGACYTGRHVHNSTCSYRIETESTRERCGGSISNGSGGIDDGGTRAVCNSCGKMWTVGTEPSSCYATVTKTKEYTVYTCGSPINTWDLTCGYNQHEVANVNTYLNNQDSTHLLHQWGDSYEVIPEGFTVTRESTPCDAYFKIQIAECQNLLYDGNKTVRTMYDSTVCNLVVDNDTVVYCKYN